MATTLQRTPDQPSAPDQPRPGRVLDLSATQLVGTVLAATTATFAASYLGVAGTVIGAALASLVTAVASAVYTQSLRRTRDRVREALPGTARRRDAEPADGSGAGRPDPSVLSRRRGAVGWQRVVLLATAVFVTLLTVVTTIEIFAGRPISDLVRGDSGRGTSVFGDGSGADAPPTPAPTVTKTVIPRIEVVTPVVTSTAPAVTRTATPTVTTTPTPTPSPTPTSSGPTSAATTTPTR